MRLCRPGAFHPPLQIAHPRHARSVPRRLITFVQYRLPWLGYLSAILMWRLPMLQRSRPAGEFLAGTRAIFPLIVAVLPIGLVFGAVSATKGLSALETT